MKKIAFFDIDGTLTSEIDGSIPQSAITAIRKARANGNLMFLNTGRCIQNVEPRFQEVGFDGFVCGCGTDIYCGGKNLLHVTQSHEITMELLKAARDTNVDIVFESSTAVAYDPVRPVIHPDAVAQYDAFVKRGYTMPTDLESPDFTCDKFVIWFQDKEQLQAFRKISDVHFNCIDRGGTFREFVPHGYSKATGIQFVLDHYNLSKEDAYAFGEKNYIRKPKKSGYQSLHLIVEVPVTYLDKTTAVRVEIQIRSVAMDYWAELDSQMCYKKDAGQLEAVEKATKQYADVIAGVDKKMLELRKKIQKM